MFANKPPNFIDELKKFPQFWKDLTSPVFEDLEELSRTRLVYDSCNFGFRVGDGGVVRLYRNPYCDVPTPQPEPEPIDDYSEKPIIPAGNYSIFFAYPKRNYTYEQGKARLTPPQGWSEYNRFYEILSIEYPYTGSVRVPITPSSTIMRVPEFYMRYSRKIFISFNGVYFRAFRASSFPYQDIENMRAAGYSIENSEGIFHVNSTYTVTNIETRDYYSDGTPNSIDDLIFIRRSRSAIESTVNNPNSAIRNRIVTRKQDLSYGSYSRSEFPLAVPGRFPGTIPIQNEVRDFYGTYYYGTGTNLLIDRAESRWEILADGYIPKKDPEPPPERKIDPMNCCTNLEQLLKLVLKKLGSTNLPATVPQSLVTKNSPTKQIHSISEYQAYTVKQLAAITGKYPINIKIEDSDLTQEGNQEKTLNMPNMAESLAEIIGMLLVLRSESNANLIATINAMIEAGNAKQLSLLAYDYAKANSEYLGYKGKQIERDIPFSFKPGEKQLDKMLVAGNAKVKGFENDDKEDLNDFLAPVLEMAAMWKAQNFRNLGTSATLDSLKKIFTDAIGVGDGMDALSKIVPPPDPNNPNAPQPEIKKNAWDEFVEEAEQGFIAQPGIQDNVNPYGRPFEQRPKIKEIGMDTSDTED